MENAEMQLSRAMRCSLLVGFFMLAMKCYAYWVTGSAAILSDAAESVVHVFAVGFAAYSLRLSLKPADRDHAYGHDRIAFFSAGFEGALIVLAGGYILYEAIGKLINGSTLDHIDRGMLFILLATILNGFLGSYLILQGKKHHSLVLEADGKHILTDCITSSGVILALVLTRLTGWLPFDPLIALLIGCNILWTGFKLIRSAIGGLMDETDKEVDAKIREVLCRESTLHAITYHNLRHRNAGNRLLIDVHLLFPHNLSISKAHELATQIERAVDKAFSMPTEMTTHLEPIEGHDEVHAKLLGREG